MPNHPRPRRVAIRGARMQFANTPADLMNVSRTGALIRLGYQPRTGGEWPLVLELPEAGPVWLTGRVVRSRRLDDASPSGLSTLGSGYLLALRFVNPSTDAQAILDEACGMPPAAASSVAAPVVGRGIERRLRSSVQRLRRLSLSLRRRCPECGSVEVAKEISHRYACEQCGLEFAGFRLGPLRVSL